jgi:hypothetical protein
MAEIDQLLAQLEDDKLFKKNDPKLAEFASIKARLDKSSDALIEKYIDLQSQFDKDHPMLNTFKQLVKQYAKLQKFIAYTSSIYVGIQAIVGLSKDFNEVMDLIGGLTSTENIVSLDAKSSKKALSSFKVLAKKLSKFLVKTDKGTKKLAKVLDKSLDSRSPLAKFLHLKAKPTPDTDFDNLVNDYKTRKLSSATPTSSSPKSQSPSSTSTPSKDISAGDLDL